ncbi:uncharacterized protein APUU_10216S [Aspergillus puulaauensis]|uniref:Major facilitator superfamily (MFS) profile domain-containing protein n=1 Tax=Aspergillus puulaauensis TaxID=1220207 RepID=A0A7R7XAC3_9EURO|nr:uncharacterized protein APUU_10216S [Aspergillus puulaauensis]BCS17388.1 hypothetical protein APUU_10216S [Aspergillus puulaauensis]
MAVFTTQDGDKQGVAVPGSAHIELANSAIAQPPPRADGKAGADNEHAMTLKDGAKAYPYAIAWSVVFSMAVVMEGYDIILVSSFLAQPAFQRRYGSYYGPEQGYQISGPWQAGLANSTSVGTIFGALANGWLSQRFGYRKTLLGSLAFCTGSIFITFFARNLAMLCAGCFLSGLPWGGISCQLCMLLLGSRVAAGLWGPAGLLHGHDGMGVQDPIRFAMDLAGPADHLRLVRPRVAMAASPERPA